MAVMAKETWTDERLDDLRADMNRRFDEAKQEARDLQAVTRTDIESLQAETKAEFKELRGEMNGRLNAMDTRFDSLQKTLVLGVVSMSVSIIGALLAA